MDEQHTPADVDELEQQLQSAKSIQDIKKEAFESGRIGVNCTSDGNFEFEMDVCRSRDSWEKRKYEIFEDYLKSKENDS